MKYKRLQPAFVMVMMGASMPMASWAADAQHDYAVRGIGALQCSTFLNFDPKADFYRNIAVENWLLGYLTAENRLTPDTYDIMALQDPQIFPNIIAALCKANPDASIEAVVADLVKQFQPIKIDQASPLLTLTVGTNKVAIRKATFMLVEKALRDGKYYHGRADGTFGPDVQHALEKFQKDQKLPVTGLPDADTIIRLLIELPERSKHH